ncbi:hypothetical protein [Pseudoalteromonas sp. S16_S37]|nr:hypothetical protein [Pseudoalteromonas sp. S16_S37]
MADIDAPAKHDSVKISHSAVPLFVCNAKQQSSNANKEVHIPINQ